MQRLKELGLFSLGRLWVHLNSLGEPEILWSLLQFESLNQRRISIIAHCTGRATISPHSYVGKTRSKSTGYSLL